MKYLRFFPGVFLFLVFRVSASEPLVFEYSANTSLTPFMEYCYFLWDPAYAGSQAPPENAAFIPGGEVDFDRLSNPYWMKFSIRNKENRQVNIQLFLGLSEKLDFFVPSGDGFRKYPAGTFESRKVTREVSGAGKTFLSQALITLGPGETQTYYAFFNHLSKGVQASRDSRLSPLLIDFDIWASKNNTTDAIWNLIFGCFLILILYHFVYFFFTRDSAYLYYSIFVFTVSFPFLTLTRDIVDKPEYNALLFFSVSGLFSVFYFQLTRKFIALNQLLPKWDRTLRYYILGKTALVVIYCLLHLITRDIFVILSTYIPALFIELILMVLLAVALIKTKDRISLLFVIGSSLAWVGMLAAIVTADPATSFTPQMTPFAYAAPAYGFVLESLFFAMVLAYRSKLNEIQKKEAQGALIKQLQENKLLQEKVTRELEEKVADRTRTIEEERQKSEKLLLSVLPQTIVEEMKETGTTKPRRFDNVSVLYSDFVEFSRISEKMSPESLVERLDHIFRNFDSIAAKNHMEKIKTIGDAYMCVSGLPNPDGSHALNAVRAALEFQEFLRSYNASLEPGSDTWNMRIGIHAGPVVAGVIGDYKFTYDVWGDTVNTASRLESHSEGGKINISEEVFQLIKDAFVCKKRGSFKVKNKGDIRMYFVEREIG